MDNNDDGFPHDAAPEQPPPAGDAAAATAPAAAAADQPTVLNIMAPGAVRMDKYNGSVPWRTYLNQFLRIAGINGWQQRLKDYLWIHLEGDALQFADEIPDVHELQFEDFCECLSNRFNSDRLHNVQKAELLSRKRRSGEDLAKLGQSIRHLVSGAYPRFPIEAKEEMSMEKFLDAIHPELRKQIYQQNPKTLEEAVEIGLKLEAWGLVEEKKHGARARITTEIKNEGESDNESESIRLIKNLQKQVEELRVKKSDDSKSRKCFYCEKVGHIARDCYAKKRDEARGKITTAATQPTKTCYRCGGRGHISTDCSTPPEN